MGSGRFGKRSAVPLVAVAVASIGIGGGVAFALLGGNIGGVNLAAGLASGQAQPCQEDPINFELVAPRWDGTDKAFVVRQVDYADVSAQCVSAGARLHIVVTEGNSTFLDTVVSPDAASGSVPLDMPLNANRAPDAEINYLVEG